MKVGKKRVGALPNNEEGLPFCVRTKESGKKKNYFKELEQVRDVKVVENKK